MVLSVADYLRPKSLYHCFLLMVALAMAIHVYALPTRSMVRLEAHNTRTTLPFLPDMKTVSTDWKGYTYSFSIYYNNTSIEQTGYSITPGECVDSISVNHSLIPFHRPGGCDPHPGAYWNVYASPIYIDLAPYVHNGRDTIEVHTRRPEFDMGPIILYGNMRLSKWLGLAMILVTCCMLVLLMERRTGEPYGGYLLACGFLVYMNRLSHMGVNQYSMDLPGHIDYITYIANHWSLPRPFTGWSYYHAPLYYVMGAIIVNCVDMFRSFDTFACLQLFSLSCFLAFLIFSIMTLRRLIVNPVAYYAAIILLIFYPSGIMFSFRMDSNLLFYACYSACLYYTLRWLQSSTHDDFVRNFGMTIILLGLAMASRANALILFPLLFLAIVYRRIKWGWPSGLTHTPWVRMSLIVFCLGMAVGVGRTEFYRLTDTRHDPFLVGNSHKLPRCLILQDASFSRLVIPDIPLYLRHPLWSVFSNENGRQYFWNSMLKSSLFGEFNWGAHWQENIINILLLVIIVYTIDGYLIHRRFLRSCPEWWLCLLSLAIPIAALMENRILYPFSSSEDFRYIYPALASFCGLFGLILERHIHEWRPFRNGLGIALCGAFSLCSAWFYLI